MVEWAFGTIGAGRYADAGWNINKFFDLYKTNRANAPLVEKTVWDALSIRANLSYSLLKEREMMAAGSGMLAPFAPTTTQARIQEAQAEARRSADLAAAEAQRLNLAKYAKQAQYQTNEVTAEGAEEMRNAPNAYRDALKMEIFGVPAWGWAAAGVALFVWSQKK